LQPGDHVLEIGFGGGYLLGKMLPLLTQGQVTGVDVSQAMVHHCRNKYRRWVQSGRLDVQTAAAERLPFEAQCFTKICSINSIFYWQDAPQALVECRRVLVKGGRLVLCFTSKASLAGRSFSQHGLTLYDAPDIVDMLQAVGFTQSEVQQAQDAHRTFWCITASA
jgi:ubiquinone/menaquinone biosynthesis C-methylase UbiE